MFIDVEKYSSISESYFPSLAMLHSGGKAGYWHIFGINTIPKGIEPKRKATDTNNKITIIGIFP